MAESFGPLISEPPGSQPGAISGPYAPGRRRLGTFQEEIERIEREHPGKLNNPRFYNEVRQVYEMARGQELDARRETLEAYSTLGQILGLEKSKRGPLIKMAGEMYGAKHGMDTETLTKMLSQVDDDTGKALAKALQAYGVETQGDPAALLEVLNPQEAFAAILRASKQAQAEAAEAERNKIAGTPVRRGLTATMGGAEETGEGYVHERAPQNRDEALALLDQQEQDLLRIAEAMQRRGGIPEAQQRGFTMRRDAIKEQRERLAPPKPQGPLTEPAKLQADRQMLVAGGASESSPAIVAIDRQLARLSESGAESTVGKVGDDLARAERMYGKNSPQYNALAEALKGGGEGPKATDVQAVRGQYTGLSKDFITIRDSFGRLVEAGKNPSAAGDLALIFNYMKILDPGSVVREAEFATAQNAAGVPERVRALWNRVLEGERLSDAMRKDFLRQAEGQFNSQKRFQQALEQQYRGIAKKRGMDPDEVVVDFIGEFRKATPTATDAPAPPSPKGTAAPSAIDAARKRLGLD